MVYPPCSFEWRISSLQWDATAMSCIIQAFTTCCNGGNTLKIPFHQQQQQDRKRSTGIQRSNKTQIKKPPDPWVSYRDSVHREKSIQVIDRQVGRWRSEIVERMYLHIWWLQMDYRTSCYRIKSKNQKTQTNELPSESSRRPLDEHWRPEFNSGASTSSPLQACNGSLFEPVWTLIHHHRSHQTGPRYGHFSWDSPGRLSE